MQSPPLIRDKVLVRVQQGQPNGKLLRKLNSEFYLFLSNSMVEYGFNTNDVLFVSQSSTATHLMLCCGCLYTHDIDICGVHKHLKCHELVWLVKRGDH